MRLKVELRHLRYFVAVAEERSFVRGAERLLVAQPALSRQIRDLEDELSFALFERSPKGLKLTSPGQTFFVEAKRMLAMMEAAVAKSRASRDASDSVVMAATHDVFAMKSFSRLLGVKTPGGTTALPVRFLTRPADESVRLVADGGVDFALLPKRRIKHKRLLGKTIYQEPAVVAVPADHAFQHADGLPAIRVREAWADDHLERLEEAFGHSSPIVGADDWASALMMVSTGNGRTIVPQGWSQLGLGCVSFYEPQTHLTPFHYQLIYDEMNESRYFGRLLKQLASTE